MLTSCSSSSGGNGTPNNGEILPPGTVIGGTTDGSNGSSGGGSGSGSGSTSDPSSSAGGGTTTPSDPNSTPPDAETTPNATRLTVFPAQARVSPNGEISFGAQLLDTNDQPIDIASLATSVTWSSESPLIATINDRGAARGVQIGATRIALTLRYNGVDYAASADLTVASDVTVRALALAPTRAELRIGDHRSFVLRAYGSAGLDTKFGCPEPRSVSYATHTLNAAIDAGDPSHVVVNVEALATGTTALVLSCNGIPAYPVAIAVTARPPLPPLPDTPASSYGDDVAIAANNDAAIVASFEESQQRAVVHTLQDSWVGEFPSNTGTSHGRHARIALDPLRTQQPTMCATDGDNLACWLRVDDGTWNKVTVAAWPNGTGGEQRQLRMTMSSTGVLSLLYFSPTTATLNMASSRIASRDDWTTTEVATGAVLAGDLALAADNTPRIALLRNDGIYFGAPTAANTWQFERIDANANNVAVIALAIAADGRAHVLTARNDGLWRARKLDTGWSNQQIIATTATPRAIDYAIDSKNIAHAAYLDANAAALHLGTEIGASLIAPSGWLDDDVKLGTALGPDLDLSLFNGDRAAIGYRDANARSAQLFVEPLLLSAVTPPTLPTTGASNGAAVQQPITAVVGGLTATPGNSAVALRWNAASGALHYNVYWSNTSNVTTAGNAIKKITSTSYDHLNLTNGTTYYYAVTSVGELGESALSNIVSAMPQLQAPTNTHVDSDVGINRVTWDTVPHALNYTIFWNTVGSPTTNDASATITDGNTVFNHSGVNNATTYYYAVQASDGTSSSGLSNTIASLPTPQAASAQAPYQDGSIQVTWNAVSGATSYKVYVSETPGIAKTTARYYTSTSTTFWHNDLTNLSTWYYAVVAVNATSESALSNESSATAIVNNGPVVWGRAAPLLSSKFLLASATVNGVIYAVGGYDGVSTLSTVEAYTPATDSWRTVKPLITPRRELAVVSANNLLYAMGGWDGNNVVASVMVYDPSTDTWRNMSSMPQARSDFTAATVNGKIYAFGGWNSGYLNNADIYDTATNRWSALPPMPSARSGIASTVIGDKIYVVGGWNGSAALNTVDVFDTVTQTWSTLAAMPTARNRLVVAALNGKIYAIGGWSGTTPIGTVEVYDPRTNGWTAGPPMPTSRNGSAGAVLNNHIYSLGGWNGTRYVNNVEALGPQ